MRLLCPQVRTLRKTPVPHSGSGPARLGARRGKRHTVSCSGGGWQGRWSSREHVGIGVDWDGELVTMPYEVDLTGSGTVQWGAADQRVT